MMASATMAINIIVPLLAGNLPLMTHSCPWKYLLAPNKSVRMLIPRKAEPRGLPSRRSVALSELPLPSDMVVLRRKSCVTATPMDAKANEVRSHARNVRSNETTHRSAQRKSTGLPGEPPAQGGGETSSDIHTQCKMVSRNTSLVLQLDGLEYAQLLSQPRRGLCRGIPIAVPVPVRVLATCLWRRLFRGGRARGA